MRFSPLVDRIAGEETGAWRVHWEGVRRREAGHDVIFLTVGDPDQAAPEAVLDALHEAVTTSCPGAARESLATLLGGPMLQQAIETVLLLDKPQGKA